MSFVRRLVIQTDYKILVTEGDEIWFLAWLLNCFVVTGLIVFSKLYTKNKNKKNEENGGAYAGVILLGSGSGLLDDGS